MIPNYERPPFSPVLKDEARIVAKKAKTRAVARMDKAEKEKVRQRDKACCRVCGRKTRDVHERLFKSLGGVASLFNSLCACRICHEYLQHHGIKPLSDPVKGCNDKRMMFQMSAAVAHHVFRGMAVPKHVEIVAVNRRTGG